MRHDVKITLSPRDAPGPTPILFCKRAGWFQRLWTLLTHRKQMMVFIPGERVDAVDITEVLEHEPVT